MLLLFAFVGWWYIPIISGLINGRGRIYQNTDEPLRKFPGFGIVSENVKDQIFVNPISVGIPIFTAITERDLYPSKLYQVTEIPEQEKINYVVGRVIGWTNIKGSKDEYLILATGKGWNKYRVAYEDTGMFGTESTIVSVEDISLVGPTDIESPEHARPVDIGKAVMHKLVKRGDVVVVLPVWDIPDLSKKDEANNYLGSRIVVRRIGGVEQLKQEQLDLGGTK